jgi:ATP-dependent exoDNAse (exonuclease V) alpha subunit
LRDDVQCLRGLAGIGSTPTATVAADVSWILMCGFHYAASCVVESAFLASTTMNDRRRRSETRSRPACTPTGGAAKRVSDTSVVHATTIHRLLQFDPTTGEFKHGPDNPLEGDVFVVDETSMVDLLLAHQFVKAVPKHAALLLVGDLDQLPSVGPGSVLRGVIDSGVVPVCRLTKVFRRAAQSNIIINAHRINRWQPPVFPRGRVEDVRG